MIFFVYLNETLVWLIACKALQPGMQPSQRHHRRGHPRWGAHLQSPEFWWTAKIMIHFSLIFFACLWLQKKHLIRKTDPIAIPTLMRTYSGGSYRSTKSSKVCPTRWRWRTAIYQQKKKDWKMKPNRFLFLFRNGQNFLAFLPCI